MTVNALEVEIAETLKSLDPLRAKTFERAIHELLLVVRPEAKADNLTPQPAVDAKGWPLGYWEKFAGCWASLEFEPPADPPPSAGHPPSRLTAGCGTKKSRSGRALSRQQSIDGVTLICDFFAMKTLVEAIQVADQLSSEDQAGLAAHLLAGIRACPLGPNDVELQRREAEMDTDSATLLTHEQLRQAVGR